MHRSHLSFPRNTLIFSNLESGLWKFTFCSVCSLVGSDTVLLLTWARRIRGELGCTHINVYKVKTRSQIYTDSLQLCCQTPFYADLLPSPSSISPSPQKNPSDMLETHDPTRPGQGGHSLPTRTRSWLCYCFFEYWCNNCCFTFVW